MSLPSYVCIYTRCPGTEFRWTLQSCHAITSDNDVGQAEEVKDILIQRGFLHIGKRLCGDIRTFRVVNGIDLAPDIDENDDDNGLFYTYRQWLFDQYPEWFANPECRTCRGNGVFNESHGNAGWLGESLLCDCCNVDHDNDLLRRNP